MLLNGQPASRWRSTRAASCPPAPASKSRLFAGDVVIPAGVKNLVLKFADGSRLRLMGVTVGGARMIGYGLPNRPTVVRMLEYGFAGQLVGSLPGVGWRC